MPYSICMAKCFFILLSILYSTTPLFAGDYSITLYTIPSRKQIDFSTPRRMAWIAFGNSLTMNNSQRKNAMGHVFIELSGPGYNVVTGSTKDRMFVSGRRELMKGYGLGLLFRGIDGKLEFDGTLTRDLPLHYYHGDIAFIKAQISRENFERLVFYLEEYQLRGYDTIYNGLNKPREGLGAGCTAFGMSFFDVAGIVQSGWEEQWAVSVRVPYRLIGGPATGNFVPVEELFTTRQWASEDEPHRVFRIIDPYLIYDWIHEAWDRLTSGVQQGDGFDGEIPVPVLRGKARGLVYDFIHYPMPEEPVFLPPSEVLKY
jgi:hypothetical protein